MTDRVPDAYKSGSSKNIVRHGNSPQLKVAENRQQTEFVWRKINSTGSRNF